MRERQHYIPEFLIKRFCDKCRNLYAARTSESPPRVFSARPKNIFVKGNRYSLQDTAISDPNHFEKQFSKFETMWSQIIGKIVDSVIIGKVPELNKEELFQLRYFFVMLWMRNPDAFHEIATENVFAQAELEALSAVVEKYGHLTDEQLAALQDPGFQRQMRNDGPIRAFAHYPKQSMDFLETKGFIFARIYRIRWGFILGSYPVLPAANLSNMMLHREEVAWLPISPEVAISPGGAPQNFEICRVRNPARVLKFNKKIAKKSSLIASENKKQIESVIAKL